MRKYKAEILLGLGFLVFLGIAFYTTVLQQKSVEELYPYRLNLYYSRIDGIKLGTQVSVMGIPFGIVKRIDVIPVTEVLDPRNIDPSKKSAIQLTLAIREPITLWDNFEVRFRSDSVLGGRSIDIYPGGVQDVGTPFFRPLDTSPDRPTELEEFFPQSRYYDDVFMGATRLLEDNRQDLRGIVSNLNSITNKLNQKKGTLPLWINTTENYDELVETTNDAKIILQDARRYQEGYRNLESAMPIPFTIRASFYGRTTLLGIPIGPQN